MTIKVKSCGDCPFAAVHYECIAIPSNPFIYSYIAEQLTHPLCPLKAEPIIIELEPTKPQQHDTPTRN